MLRLVFITIVILFGGALLGQWISNDTGYVLIAYRGLAWESSLWGAVLFFSLLGFSIFIVYKLIASFIRLPNNLGDWWGTQNKKRLENKYDRAIFHLIGLEAQKALKALGDPGKGERNLLLGFETALRTGEYKQAEKILRELKENKTLQKNSAVFDKASARVYFGLKQYQRAFLLIKDHIPSAGKNNAALYALGRDICVNGELWEELGTILHKDAPVEDYELYFKKSGDLEKLRSKWNGLDKVLQTELLSIYAQRQMQGGQDDLVESAVRETLEKEPSRELIHLYGRITSAQSMRQLSFLEELAKKLQKSEYKEELLMSMAHLCIRNKTWQQGLAYYASLSEKTKFEDYEKERIVYGLAQIAGNAEQANQKNKAQELIRKFTAK